MKQITQIFLGGESPTPMPQKPPLRAKISLPLQTFKNENYEAYFYN